MTKVLKLAGVVSVVIIILTLAVGTIAMASAGESSNPDPGTCMYSGECPNGDCFCDGDGPVQEQIRDCTCDGDYAQVQKQLRYRTCGEIDAPNQACFGECTGVQLQKQDCLSAAECDGLMKQKQACAGECTGDQPQKQDCLNTVE